MVKTTDSNLLRISEKYSSYYYNFENAFQNISSGGFAMLEGELFLQANIRTRFTDKWEKKIIIFAKDFNFGKA